MKRIYLFVLLALPFLWTGALLGQTIITGSVTGTVTDPQGAVVAGAPVVLKSLEKGTVHNSKTNSAGLYRFDYAEPGSYTVTVDQPGFKKLEARVQIQTDQVLGEDLKLTLGSDTQTVQVTTEARGLQTEDGSVSTTISESQVQEIPNSGLNMSYLTRLVPGYGGAGTTLYTVDGMLNNDTYGNSGDTGANNLMLGLSEVKEATVSVSAYSGQIGGLAGAQVNFVTKGGTNRVRGNAGYYWTGRALYANDWFNDAHGTPKPSVDANQWTADIGFPVFKNRLFLYTDTEGIRLIIPPSTTGTLIPSPALEAATIANLTSKGLTKSIPFYQQLFTLYNNAPGAVRAVPGNGSLTAPTNGCPTAATAGTANAPEVAEFATLPNCTLFFEGGSQTYSNEWLVNVRGDFVINSHDSGFARVGADLGLQPSSTSQINALFNTVSWQPLHTGQLNETHLFGTRAISSFLATGYWYQSLFGPANVGASLAAFPAAISLGDGTFTGTGPSSTTGRIPASGQVQDDMSVFLGKHTFKFGGRLYVTKLSDYSFGGSKVPTLTVNTLGAFYGGGIDATYTSKGANPTSSISQGFSAFNSYPLAYHQLGVYVEDDWQAKPNLTLTVALRVDEQSNLRCLKDCVTRTLEPFPALQQGVGVPYNQALTFNQQDALPGISGVNWQPRVGFAYTPPILNKTLVIRGGVGAFADRLGGSLADSLTANAPNHPVFSESGDNLANTESTNLFADVTAFNAAVAGGILNGGTLASIKSSLTPAQQATFAPPTLYSTQNNLKIDGLYKWNLEVQKSFPWQTVVSVNYLGQRGNHVQETNTGLNAYSATVGGLPATAPDPRFGKVTYLFSGGNTAYDAIVAQVTKRLPNAGTFTAGYTYSKAWSTTAVIDPYHPLSNWGPSSDGSILTINYVYHLPFKNIIYGGWQLSGTAYATSGTQFSVTDPTSTSLISGSTSSGGNYGGSLLATYLGGGETKCANPRSACLSKTEFASATSVVKSQTRPLFRGPDYITTDLTLIKAIPLHWEGGKFSFGAQAYNILNHPNFSTPSATLSSSTFGQITSTKNSTGIFSGVGGDDSPRILQIVGKLSF
jgi:Carboxypeptidase regulatory-like domain